jgi:hypothetical protein
VLFRLFKFAELLIKLLDHDAVVTLVSDFGFHRNPLHSPVPPSHQSSIMIMMPAVHMDSEISD